jgi:hypothetical protein
VDVEYRVSSQLKISSINILNMLFTLPMHFVGFNSF